MFKRLLLLKQIPDMPNLSLLVLRVVVFGSLFLRHGTEKLFGLSQAPHFGDPIHIGPIPSFLFATLSDGICTLLLALGLFTRWASVIVFINVFVAWAFVHHFIFFPHADGYHGELIVIYMGVAAALFLRGAGKYSLDALIDKSSD